MSSVQIQKLIDEGRYKEATDLGMDFVKANPHDYVSRMLMARAFFMQLDPKDNSDIVNDLYKQVTIALQTTPDEEAFFSLAAQTEDSMYQWHAAYSQRAIQGMTALINKASVNPQSKFIEGKVLISMATAQVKKIAAAVAQEKGYIKDEDEFAAKLNQYAPNIDREYGKRMEREYVTIASRIMINKLVEFFEQNRILDDRSLAKQLGDYVFYTIGRVSFLLGTAIKDNSDPVEKNIERKKLYAYMLDFELNATVVIERSYIMSILVEGSRSKPWKELQELYAAIAAADPSFEIPEMPPYEETKQAINNTASQSGGGCYVATAVYGSYDCPQVWTLRRYRDNVLAESWYGRLFIRAYYAISPTLVKWFGDTAWFKNLWKGKLDRMVAQLQEKGVQSTPYQDKNW